jgi:NAD+ synthase
MAAPLRLALAQLDLVVGDIAGNEERLRDYLDRAREAGAQLVLFPELAVKGYPPEDLLLKRHFLERSRAALDRLAADVRDIVAVVGFPELAEDVFNSSALLAEGEVKAIYRKVFLPNYGVFDEQRYFRPGASGGVVDFEGVRVGMTVCEDVWEPGPPLTDEALAGATLILNASASPYHAGKGHDRELMFAQRARDSLAVVAYCNLVGGQDELVFDGSSFIVHPDGERVVQLCDWEEALLVTDWERTVEGWRCTTREMHALDAFPEDVYRAMMVGMRDYVQCNGFGGVILGLSGGIDSALSAAVAVDALGPDKVSCVMLPSKYTSDESLEDARECARLLGCRHDVVSIAPAVTAVGEMLPDMSGLAAENVQARLRMVALMALSNSGRQMLLTTGNKSEMSVGYATLYGDMAGGYSVLKDAYKTTVFALSRWRNANKPEGALGPDGPVMPTRVITKPPTAELRPGQKDEDSLPPYSVLDRILEGLVDREMSVKEVANATGEGVPLVADIESKLLKAEYKRRQAPPGVKIGNRNFGRDRRYPITNFFHTGPQTKLPR